MHWRFSLQQQLLLLPLLLLLLLLLVLLLLISKCLCFCILYRDSMETGLVVSPYCHPSEICNAMIVDGL